MDLVWFLPMMLCDSNFLLHDRSTSNPTAGVLDGGSHATYAGASIAIQCTCNFITNCRMSTYLITLSKQIYRNRLSINRSRSWVKQNRYNVSQTVTKHMSLRYSQYEI